VVTLARFRSAVADSGAGVRVLRGPAEPVLGEAGTLPGPRCLRGALPGSGLRRGRSQSAGPYL